MAPRPPTKEELAAFRARASLREREERRRRDARKTRLRWVFWLFGLVLLAALAADVRHLSGRLGRFQRTGKESRKGDERKAGGLEGPRMRIPPAVQLGRRAGSGSPGRARRSTRCFRVRTAWTWRSGRGDERAHLRRAGGEPAPGRAQPGMPMEFAYVGPTGHQALRPPIQ